MVLLFLLLGAYRQAKNKNLAMCRPEFSEMFNYISLTPPKTGFPKTTYLAKYILGSENRAV